VALLGPAGRAAAQGAVPPAIELSPGLVITRSVRVVPRVYRLPAPASLDSAAVTVRGDDVTVDFAGAVLQGMASDSDPDRAAGVAIRVVGGRNVRLLHARVRGYRVGVLARDTRGLTLVDDDVSYTWKPRLFSLVEHESLVDWLSFHHNERDEWLRYGAGLYLAGVSGGEIQGNRARQGMNGLMLVRSDHVLVRDNDFSFNSGAGLALYRSSDNTIVHNRLDYDVRGYSHRFYHRGQDSAGLLMYEQSSRNVVAYNSITHGGDGLFLWAGQSTMDSGDGGANDNLFSGNDLSFAPANGIEATFSRNRFVANRAAGNDYGMWGGYSFASQVVGNDFRDNRVGIAIEHGQDNLIAANRFTGDSTAVWLWADSIAPSAWGYPRHRDTRSHDYRVDHNVFVGNRVAVRAANTSGLLLARNRFVAVDSVTVFDNVTTTDTVPSVPPPPPPPRLPPGARAGPGSALTHRDRSAIVVDEWGRSTGAPPSCGLWTRPGRSRCASPRSGPPAHGAWWRGVAWRRCRGRRGESETRSW
jgi:parallel beta-helix repeat protein